ncbi:MAG: thiamine-phosphate kinase [Deltaproteobacteria bacterium]|nr:thiamine-phosphate kinase [Deltaproteobacteria bacterium]
MKRTIASIGGEFAFIRKIAAGLTPRGSLKVGIGDDCAVIRSGSRDLLLTTDMLVEGVHFRREWTSPYQLGRKILSVNLSDIAAMGGRPLYTLLAAAVPPRTPVSFLDELLRGFRAVARKFGVQLAGGDTNATPGGMVFSVTVVGQTLAPPVLRSGAKAGDDIYVTGPLGRSALGLALLKKENRFRGRHEYRSCLRAHLDPEPRIAEGAWLARHRIPHAMIDISDGLLSDLRHILKASRVGAVLEWEKIPHIKRFETLARKWSLSTERLLLTGGEEYELLFTAPPRYRTVLKRFYRIGNITKTIENIEIIGLKKGVSPPPVLGYNHFSSHP